MICQLFLVRNKQSSFNSFTILLKEFELLSVLNKLKIHGILLGLEENGRFEVSALFYI